ncbi:hypothetical protein BDF14DRAFT_1791203 [Spinellus fusiger]|nr:hypothetical protein BDF14DRAFT_1791203 [Spinellus fusiger]
MNIQELKPKIIDFLAASDLQTVTVKDIRKSLERDLKCSLRKCKKELSSLIDVCFRLVLSLETKDTIQPPINTTATTTTTTATAVTNACANQHVTPSYQMYVTPHAPVSSKWHVLAKPQLEPYALSNYWIVEPYKFHWSAKKRRVVVDKLHWENIELRYKEKYHEEVLSRYTRELQKHERRAKTFLKDKYLQELRENKEMVREADCFIDLYIKKTIAEDRVLRSYEPLWYYTPEMHAYLGPYPMTLFQAEMRLIDYFDEIIDFWEEDEYLPRRVLRRKMRNLNNGNPLEKKMFNRIVHKHAIHPVMHTGEWVHYTKDDFEESKEATRDYDLPDVFYK